jgi:antitoxin CcdA
MGKIELKLDVDESVLRQVEEAGLDPSAVALSALAKAARRQDEDRRARAWAEENAEAIAAHRERIEKYGVFGDDLRTW